MNSQWSFRLQTKLSYTRSRRIRMASQARHWRVLACRTRGQCNEYWLIVITIQLLSVLKILPVTRLFSLTLNNTETRQKIIKYIEFLILRHRRYFAVVYGRIKTDKIMSLNSGLKSRNNQTITDIGDLRFYVPLPASSLVFIGLSARMKKKITE